MGEPSLFFVAQFLDYLGKERRYSTNTVNSYRIDLTQFIKFINVHEGSGAQVFDGVKKSTIKSFLSYLMEKGQSPRSISRKLVTVRSFFKFLVRTGIVDSNPASQIKSPKIPKKLPEFLPEEIIKHVLEAASEKAEIIEDIRDIAIIELLYSTGIRLHELIQLNVHDLDVKEMVVRVRGKGQKDRVIPVGRKAIDSVNNYICLKRKNVIIKNNEPLFTSRRGNRLSPRTIQIRLKKLFENVSVGTNITPHILRHTFATHLLNNGADIRAVKELLGHASLSSTQIYTHLKVDQLIKEYKQSHPHAK